MNEESIDNTNNITSNFKMLAKSISSAQSNIFRCKSTLKSIEDELIYLNANNNTNTNNREYKKPEESIDSAHIPSNFVEIDAEPTKNDYFIKHFYPENLGKSTKSRKLLSKMAVCQSQESHNNMYNKNTNVCNISGELNNLMRAQQKLICQIEQLKCEIREKAGSIDMCLRDNQYFSCKFKEIECDIDHLKKDVDKIKRDLAQNSNRDRGFSPYSQESFRKDNPNIQPPLKNYNGRLSTGEMHYGYQDICTPENSVINGPMINKSSRNILLNVRDPQGNSRTFEDLMKKSKLDIDCNINNCRNNQNAASLLYPIQSSPVLNDFANLTNQIRNLRKMAESIFKSHNGNEIKKPHSSINVEESNISKSNDPSHEDHSKSSVSRPVVETTLSILNQAQFKPLNSVTPANAIKHDTSSESASISGSDTSACLCTEDQFPIHSPQKNSRHNSKKIKDHDHFCTKDIQSNNFIANCLTKHKKHTNLLRNNNNENLIRKHEKCKDIDKGSKKQDLCTNCISTPMPCSKIRDICICQMKRQICQNRSVCAECHQYIPNFGN